MCQENLNRSSPLLSLTESAHHTALRAMYTARTRQVSASAVMDITATVRSLQMDAGRGQNAPTYNMSSSCQPLQPTESVQPLTVLRANFGTGISLHHLVGVWIG
eukprot:COSAG02_NODE_39744_length_413_cov_0.987261_1_plen_103_part_10